MFRLAHAPRRLGCAIGFSAVAVAVMLGMATGASAATQAVTNTNDSGPGSLRAAIAAAAGNDTVDLTGVAGTIKLAFAIKIPVSMSIVGPGANLLTLDGGHNDRIFSIAATAAVSLSGLTFYNGNGCFTNPCSGSGGAIADGNSGGAGGLLTINHCVFANNEAGFGGAIYTQGDLTVTNSTFFSNAVASRGGAIYSAAFSPTLTIVGNTFIGNGGSAPISGGAIYSGADGTITLNNNTFVGNGASSGGAIHLYNSLTPAQVAMTNNTFFNNRADFGCGGAILAETNTNVTGLSLVINNTVFQGNTSTPMSGGAICGKADHPTDSIPSVSAEFSVFYGNSDDVSNPGGLVDLTNIVNSDPMLLPLGNYGGPTQTMLPQPGSPGIGAGTFTPQVATLPTTDQRGFLMNLSSVDIGAAQTNYLIVTKPTDATDNFPDCNSGAGMTCSLREALAIANAVGSGDIVFNSALDGATFTMVQPAGSLQVAVPLYLQGPPSGFTLDGGGLFQLLNITSGANAVISGLNVAHGNSAQGGGISNDGQLTMRTGAFMGNSSAFGGAISNTGSLTLSGITFSNNSATSSGGAIYSANSAPIAITNDTFVGNSAGRGGALFSQNVSVSGQLMVSNSTFSSNSATQVAGCGGAIDAVIDNSLGGNLALTIANNVFQGNSGQLLAGGICGEGGAGLGPSIAGSNNLFFQNTVNGNSADVSNSGGTTTLSAGLNADAMLLPLGSYGGPTQTLLPLPGSAAICAGSPSLLAAQVATDQRGFPRVNAGYQGFSHHAPCLDLGAVQTNYKSIQFANAASGYAAKVGQPAAPAPIVSVTENGQNIGGIPVTFTFSGTGNAAGLMATTVARTGATFSSLVVDSIGSDTLSATLTIVPANSLPPFMTNAAVSITTVPSASLSVTGVPQTISFTGPASPQYAPDNSPVSLSASPDSGLTVTFSSNTPIVCTVAGASVTLLGAGTCTIQADQAGNNVYLPAPSVIQSFSVQITQTINFTPISSPQMQGHTAPLSAASISNLTSLVTGLPVSFSSLTSSVCSVSGTTVSLVGAGTCTVEADQAGNGVYKAASAKQTFTVLAEFVLSSMPSTISKSVGNATLTLTVKPMNGFTGPVALTCGVIPMPAPGWKCPGLPATVNLGATNVTLSTGVLLPKGTASGIYTVTFAGTSGIAKSTAVSTITVPQ